MIAALCLLGAVIFEPAALLPSNEVKPMWQRGCLVPRSELRQGAAQGIHALHFENVADKEALRALIRIPYIAEPITLDVPALRAERAGEKLAALSGELVSDRTNPRLNFRAGSLLREMGDPAAREYFRKASSALRELAKTKEHDAEQLRLFVESLTASAEFEEAEVALAQGKLDEATTTLLRGELGIFRVWEAAGVLVKAPGGDRMLSLSLTALRRPDEATAWKAQFKASADLLKKACQLAPKDARPHRSLAVALGGQAYVESALLWRAEQKTVGLMPSEAFAHYKEASNLTPDDVIAQWEAFESRVAMEKSKGASGLPKDAAKFVATLTQRLKASAESGSSDARRAREVLGVIHAQTGATLEALDNLEKASGERPIPRVQLMRFRLLMALNRPGDAAELGQAFLQTEFSADIALGVAVALERAGQVAKADLATTEGLMREPQNPELRLARASFLLRDPTGEGLKEAGQTLDALTRLDEADPLLVEVRFLRAIYFGLIGDVEAARLILDQLPKGDRIEKAKKALKG